ncbi:MAG: polymer-forming cytoskeletal protein [Phycisphaerales bacterium]
MARKPKATSREVRCYHCGKEFEIPSGAVTTSCPSCYKRVQIEDILVKHAQGNTILGTCGKLVVYAKASIVAKRIFAIQSVEVRGNLESAVETDGPVHISPNAMLKGDCHAKTILIEPGANVIGFLSIGPHESILPPEGGLAAKARQWAKERFARRAGAGVD